MVVVSGEVFGELPAGEVVGADDAVHDAGLFEHDEVAVDGALRELGPLVEDLGDGERAGRGAVSASRSDSTVGGEALADCLQSAPVAVSRTCSDDGAAVGPDMVSSLPNGRYRRALDVTARFTELLARPEAEIALDEAALLIAAHAHPDARDRRPVAQLDTLAASRCGAVAPVSCRRCCSSSEGFRGQRPPTTAIPSNSFLDDVLDRHLGIPITLSVVMLEVGRRNGLQLHGVGMPGHFLVGGGRG